MSRAPARPQAGPPQSSLRRPSMYGARSSEETQRPPLPSQRDPRSAGPVASTSRSASRPPPALSATGTPDGRDRRKSKVDAALLRKRQSISHHNAADFAASHPERPPPLPVASSSRAGASSAGDVPQIGAGGLDLSDLNKDRFDVDQYLRQNLPPGSLSALRQLKANLQGSLDLTAVDLQKNVLKNYSEFVEISKEIATLENEMIELRTVLEEWKAVPASLEIATDSTSHMTHDFGLVAPTNRRAARNSVADLAALWRTQLEALWEGVEGSSRFLPPVPGRHLMAESASFVELNSATYKPRQGVHLFLLNDALLVAVKRRAGMGSRVRLAADRCFSLNEISIIDLKDGGELHNAIKIKRGKEATIFRGDKAEDKKLILNALKRVAEEMTSKKRKQSLWEAEKRHEPTSARSTGPGGSLTFRPSELFGFGRDDPTGKDVSWIGDLSDELAVHIATREFEQAVDLAEKGKVAQSRIANDVVASSLLRTKLDQRVGELTAALLRDLRDPAIGKSGVVASSDWLVRLGEPDRARETFLGGRADVVRRRARQIKFEGDVSLYISELAMVCFTLVKNTCEWYMAAFRDNAMASGFVRWASQQMEAFAEMFGRQVYGADQDQGVIEESLAVTRLHGLMLRDVGLDFSFHLEALLARPRQS